MRILFVCHRLPYPPARGGKIRPFNMIRFLSARHEVTVVAVGRSGQELEAGRGLEQFCHRYEVGLISARAAWFRAFYSLLMGRPASLGYFNVPQLHERVGNLVVERRFDLIWVHCSSAAQYVGDVRGCRRIMDFGDMDSEKWFQYARQRGFPLSLIYRIEGVRLRKYEKALARQFDECTVISPSEKVTLNSYGLKVPVTVIRNGVDLSYFVPTPRDYNPKSIVFLGRMDYYPNIDAVTYFSRKILPWIQRQIPGAHFTIVGSNPHRRVKKLTKLPGVFLTGTVSDVRPYLESAAVSVAPLRIARGIQNKVLESMAMAVPVVASSKAFDGIDATAGEHLLVDDSADGFAAKVVALMKNQDLRRRVAEAGRRRIEERHTWNACLSTLDQLVEYTDKEVGLFPRRIDHVSEQCS